MSRKTVVRDPWPIVEDWEVHQRCTDILLVLQLTCKDWESRPIKISGKNLQSLVRLSTRLHGRYLQQLHARGRCGAKLNKTVKKLNSR